jgi:hypothetical protein
VMSVPPGDVQVIPVLCFRVQARMDYGEAL